MMSEAAMQWRRNLLFLGKPPKNVFAEAALNLDIVVIIKIDI